MCDVQEAVQALAAGITRYSMRNLNAEWLQQSSQCSSSFLRSC